MLYGFTEEENGAKASEKALGAVWQFRPYFS